MKHILLLCTVSSLLLAACEQSPGQGDDNLTVVNGSNVENAATAGNFDASNDFRFGKTSVPALKATDIFVETCIKQTSPAKFGMKQNPSSKQWVHQNYNLSVKLSPKLCMVIFGNSDEQPLEVATMLALASSMATAESDTANIYLDPETGAGRTKGNGKEFSIARLGKSSEGNLYVAILAEK